MQDAGGALLFKQALSGVLSEPGSASAAGGYGGSRSRRQRFEYSETSRAGFVELAPDRLLTEQEFYDALKKGWLAGGVIKNGMVNLGVAPVMVRTMMVGRQGGCAMLQALPEPVPKWMRCAGRLPGTA